MNTLPSPSRSICVQSLHLFTIIIDQTTLKDDLSLIICQLTQSYIELLQSVTFNKKTQKCRMIEQYIYSHYAETITLDTLSALTFHSKYYIAHAFTKYKGISPINYLITRRIEEAKSLLEHTDFPVAKIAQAVGFSSQSYFSQAFRRETTLSPDAYRRQFLS